MLGTKATIASSSMTMITKSPSPSLRPSTIGAPRPSCTQEDIDKDKLHCNHCNGNRHTEETFFEIHEYPEWYWERKKELKAKRRLKGQAKLAESGVGEAYVVASQARPNYDVGKVAIATSRPGPKSNVDV
ncbi:hypothetical protein ACFX1T_005547 [Malus domestica]